MKNNDKGNGRRMFLLAFLLTLIGLAAVMVITVMAVQPLMSGSEAASSAAGYSYRPPAADTLTMVVIGENNSAPEDFLLIRFNPQYGQIPLTLLPGNTALTLDEQPSTLSAAYRKGGGRAVKSALGERLGIIIDRYAVISGTAFVRVASKVGTVAYTLPEDFSYTRDGYTVDLPAGERRLDGQDVLDLFACPALSADPVKKSKLLGDLVSAIVNQNLNAASDELSSGIFKLAINLVKSDLSSADYEPRRESAHFLSTLGAQISGNLPLSGKANDDGSFALSEEYVTLLQQYFQLS